ncbi:hypothetical protein [Brevundimonas phoenicis]|uniref:hypothetical protein n=1 Tax=unclassified Brevundimonas TaxID=2622653 RepID=UPI0039A28B8D
MGSSIPVADLALVGVDNTQKDDGGVAAASIGLFVINPVFATKIVETGLEASDIMFDAGAELTEQFGEQNFDGLGARLKRRDARVQFKRHPNLSLGCVETAKVEAPAVVSMMRDGGLRLSVNAFPEAA